ncbi:MAG: carbohydrate ABC transporter permease [Treponema sp.]|jgi:multiple sugar transport system permease protein/putative aldouronate transport system permease protein|nr:carbohydrate ABC transporter permease [Treponema sp.]
MATKMRLSPSDRVFYLVDYLLLLFCGVVVLLPLLNVFAQSLSDPQSVISGRVKFWPRHFTLSTFDLILKNKNIIIGYVNTLFYASVGTVINLIITVMCAYPLSRQEFVGRNVFMVIFAFTMMFSGGMIPTYIIIKNLGLLDTRWVMILPSGMAVWNMILARTFFQNTIPKELYESAELDGASDIRVLISMVLPLSGPILAVLTLFYAVSTHWNAYFDAMMYLRSQRLFNIQLILRNAMANIEALLHQTGDLGQIVQNLALMEASKYVIIVISMLPVLIIYPFVQKYFIKGIMIGAIKG